jgi:hypothetical protein
MAFVDRHLLLCRKKMAFFQFLMEGYDGLAAVTTLDAKTGKVQISTDRENLLDLAALIYTLEQDTDFDEGDGS